MTAPRYAYFVGREDDEGPIKIGSTDVPEDRLKKMMAWSPYQLKLLACVDGGLDLERRFHAAFLRDWSHGEWFNRTERMMLTIERILDGSFCHCELLPPVVLHLEASRERARSTLPVHVSTVYYRATPEVRR